MTLLCTGGKQFKYYWLFIRNKGGKAEQWNDVFKVPKSVGEEKCWHRNIFNKNTLQKEKQNDIYIYIKENDDT